MADESANNPFFLPMNENPGLVLTSQHLTGLKNYMSWARSVFLALSARNKYGFVNGSILELDPSSPLFNSWNRCNTTMLSWLTNLLSMELKASVMYINTAKDLDWPQGQALSRQYFKAFLASKGDLSSFTRITLGELLFHKVQNLEGWIFQLSTFHSLHLWIQVFSIGCLAQEACISFFDGIEW